MSLLPADLAGPDTPLRRAWCVLCIATPHKAHAAVLAAPSPEAGNFCCPSSMCCPCMCRHPDSAPTAKRCSHACHAIMFRSMCASQQRRRVAADSSCGLAAFSVACWLILSMPRDPGRAPPVLQVLKALLSVFKQVLCCAVPCCAADAVAGQAALCRVLLVCAILALRSRAL